MKRLSLIALMACLLGSASMPAFAAANDEETTSSKKETKNGKPDNTNLYIGGGVTAAILATLAGIYLYRNSGKPEEMRKDGPSKQTNENNA